jgi:dihydrofolate reductase
MVWDWGDQWEWDDELKRDFNLVIDSVGCILLSRKMAEGGFVAHWEKAAEHVNDPRFEYASKVNSKPKVVFTRTLDKSEWSNTEIAGGDLREEVDSLKNQSDKDLIVYGGATFLSSLIQEGIVDEFQLFINPIALRHGMTIFGGGLNAIKLTLLESKAYECGIVVNRYIPPGRSA